jgi:hypothetical protein
VLGDAFDWVELVGLSPGRRGEAGAGMAALLTCQLFQETELTHVR